MITRDMVLDDAARLGVEPAIVMAFSEVESANAGFLADGRPAILFEAQWFHNFTGGQFDASHPQISSPVWDRSLYQGGAREYDRLNQAIQLDAEAALKSASWGAFQIMGFNYRAAGYANVSAFVSAMKQSLNNQLEAFTGFVLHDPVLLQAVRSKDFATATRIYNGPGAVAQYSAKLEMAYQMHAKRDAAYLAGIPLPPEPLPLPSFDGPPIPAADALAPLPKGFVETPAGNLVLEDVKTSTIVQGANHGAIAGVAGTVASVGAAASSFAGLKWEVVLALGAVGIAAGVLAIVYLWLIRGRRIDMNRKGIA